MANVISQLLNKKIPAPNRSWFDLSSEVRSTCDLGYLNVAKVIECVAGDEVNMKITSKIKTNATLAPILGSVDVRFFKFFVPLRLYCPKLNLNQLNADFLNDFQLPYIPLIQSGTLSNSQLCVTPGSLMEQLGFPVGLMSYKPGLTSTLVRKFNGVPYLGYLDIWRNYFANTQQPNTVSDATFTYTADTWSCSSQSLGSLTGGGLEGLDEYLSYFSDKTWWDGYDGDITGGDLYSPICFTTMNSTGATLENYSSFLTGLYTQSTHDGLLRTTYYPDMFTTRLNTSYIDYVNSEVTVNVENGSFTISQLRQKNKLAKFVDKSVFGGTRFGEWLKIHFGVDGMEKLNIPVLVGYDKYSFGFDDVVATATTGQDVNGTVGDIGGRGLGYGGADNDTFYCSEPGYYMVLYTLTPKVDYFQNTPKFLQKTQFADLYVPEFDAIGWQQQLSQDLVDCTFLRKDGSSTDFGAVSFNTVQGYTPAWIEYMTDTNRVMGQFSTTQRFWTFGRPYGLDIWSGTESGNFSDLSTYVNPQFFKGVFASQEKGIDNYYVQIALDCKMKRPMSKQLLPTL